MQYRGVRPLPSNCRSLALALTTLLLSGLLVHAPAAHASDWWTPAGTSPVLGGEGRRFQTATLLPDGRVLVTGGILKHDTGRDEADLYDPTTNSWSAAPPMTAPRSFHTATLLPDGRVLVVGGRGFFGNDTYVTASAEVYDPAANRWSPVAPMATPREEHTATLLSDGRVLVAGGRNGGYNATNALATAELYDPVTDRWIPAGTMATTRFAHQATLLPNGQVLVAGGRAFGPPRPNDTLPSIVPLATAERYDPATDRWIATAAMDTPRDAHTLTTLPDGQVLVAGGRSDNVSGSGPTTAERYDPAADRWSPAGTMASVRFSHTATLLPDGQVLVAGGVRSGPAAERYDPATDRWTPAAPMTFPRFAHTATRLLNGEVLVTGGYDPRAEGGRGPGTAERYSDGIPAACFIETSACMRGRFLDHWQRNGGLARNGFPLTVEFAQQLEDGRAYTVQYFERVRLEHHPENQPPYDILLGQFGRRIYQDRTGRSVDPPVAPIPGQVYFTETGHNLGAGFLAYWQANGGLAQFGFPISEEFEETLEDGKTYRVQYFERARFEHHPEHPPPYDILLGQFGRQILAERTVPPPSAFGLPGGMVLP